MYCKQTTVRALLTTTALVMVACVPAQALEVNKSNLWFGGDEGIEVVWKTGKNLAYTEESPKVDPRMTKHARGMTVDTNATWPAVSLQPLRIFLVR